MKNGLNVVVTCLSLGVLAGCSCPLKKEVQEATNQAEKKIVGLSIKTNNADELNPQTAKIGTLVNKYFTDKTADKIPNRKTPGVTIAAYTQYESNEQGNFVYFIGEEVTTDSALPEGLSATTIPAGKFQKVTTETGKLPEIVLNAWKKIWTLTPEQLGGKRNFKADYEMYDQRAADQNNAVVDIFVGIE